MILSDTDRVHGGPDALGIPTYDFSTNSNACGPCPETLRALRDADATRYPDASYRLLREQLAGFHRVASERIVLAASASEFIFRITAMAARRRIREVRVPRHGYGDYRHAAHAWGLAVRDETGTGVESPYPCLSWACDPSSPLGAEHANLAGWASQDAHPGNIAVLDCAYEPLRLDGVLRLPPDALDTVWRLFSPNKALGLTGVRAAYAIAPAASTADVQALKALCPSWPLGAHGAALLASWCEPGVQAWLTGTHGTLLRWKRRQEAICTGLGCKVLPSCVNFFCVVPPVTAGLDIQAVLTGLRRHDVKLRDATSFGLANTFRLGVRPPAAQDALQRAWQGGQQTSP